MYFKACGLGKKALTKALNYNSLQLFSECRLITSHLEENLRNFYIILWEVNKNRTEKLLFNNFFLFSQ